MLLDQQFPMERAFAGRRCCPAAGYHRLRSGATIAALDPRVLRTPPMSAIHRYPGSMADRIQACSAQIGSISTAAMRPAIWTTGTGSRC